jgi:hypothetical protein
VIWVLGFEVGDDTLEFFFVPAMEDNVESLGAEFLDETLANAVACSGDKCPSWLFLMNVFRERLHNKD